MTQQQTRSETAPAATAGRIGRGDVASLDSRLEGAVVLPGDGTYDSVRRLWNGACDRHPAVIARCATTADVARAVRFAREHELLIAVRGGGHSVAGLSSCDGGMMIDLQPMQSIAVDPVHRVARRSRVSSGAPSTRRRRSRAWPPPAARCRTPASPGSPWVAASDG